MNKILKIKLKNSEILKSDKCGVVSDIWSIGLQDKNPRNYKSRFTNHRLWMEVTFNHINLENS